MERLTKKGISCCDICGAGYNGKCVLSNVFPCPDYERYAKLAAYEDTGLEPEEIIALCYMDSRAKMAKMLKTEEYYGVSIDRLKELAKADCEGRCVSFPAKVGDKVWFIKSMWNYADSPIIATIKGIRTFTDFNHFVFLTSTDRSEITRSFMAKDIGKTVFLTREEAEKALEEYNG